MSLSCSRFFFQFPSNFDILIILIIFYQFNSMVSRDSLVNNFASSLFLLLIIIRSGRLAEIRWSVWTSKSRRSLYVSFSWTEAGLCIYHFVKWSNLIFLHKFQWITLSIHSGLVWYSFSANLLHSLIMWLIVSPLAPHNLNHQFCYVLSFLALIWLVLMALFGAAIRRD